MIGNVGESNHEQVLVEKRRQMCPCFSLQLFTDGLTSSIIMKKEGTMRYSFQRNGGSHGNKKG